MNLESEKTLRNLGVISALTHNDKLNTKDEEFTVYVPTTLRGVTRFVYREGREQNIQRIQGCVRDAKQYISNAMHEIHNTHDSESSVMRQLSMSTQLQVCNRMIGALRDSIQGLQSLHVTYKDDPTSVSKLVILEHEIDDFLSTARHIASSSPTLERFK